MQQNVKVSIITSVYNNEEFILDAINSVNNQTYKNIEHIIIDGDSTDNTKDIIEQNLDKISIFISEKDSGIYDGLNKGLSLATGDIIGILHSDDLFFDNNVIQNIVSSFENNDAVYGDLIYINKTQTKIIRYWKSKKFSSSLLKNGWMPPHPTLFITKKMYQKIGFFDTSFKIAADYDFILRLFSQKEIKTKYLPITITKMRVGGASNKNLKNIINKTKEDIKALKKNNISPFRAIILKNLSKIGQFVFK